MKSTADCIGTVLSQRDYDKSKLFIRVTDVTVSVFLLKNDSQSSIFLSPYLKQGSIQGGGDRPISAFRFERFNMYIT